jgi:hypothetical protein
MLRKLRKARKLDPNYKRKRKKPIIRPDTDIMISDNSRMIFRVVMFLFFSLAVVMSGYAPKKGPKLPEGFCKYGDVTDTTGECMCHWQHKVCYVMLWTTVLSFLASGYYALFLLFRFTNPSIVLNFLFLRTAVPVRVANIKWDSPFIITHVKIAYVFKSLRMNESTTVQSRK